MYSLISDCTLGLTIHEKLDKDYCVGCSILSTYRNANLGINLAGSYGGIHLEPVSYTEDELKDAIHLYGRKITEKNFIGTSTDIIEPDVCSGAGEPSWVVDTLLNDPSNDTFIYFEKIILNN